ncbi:succinyl-CoA ligase [ADP-forming] subunit beta [Ehrlichia chaffeensis str. Heartland]|uniref:Succinate--CoA ligase [ADP-forming] subunit beta n=1 Tax=Ehrlichia chaffeensis (strain ATCC CRL-10679 / Arkansas) TaxID=205920 RepID=SUCC_EHRCR|nr:ADP-forming succinate--CoA ligase subunit beta [Ehrlichia chaffeensis]Q2GFL7.1 RecName: Full=Succinate--CoA ligase [ADP-forming] subunit beta; AltName: Full=Succinyl-CoA synthetase subunit beta; Short=SCS-beta [Ehrlichia chaffeensis str. Arkansas]ABD45205.1 succinyl-CoA synthetase, beta subunit [Ehrlichia chaffeensis str. Arkansas]AHX03997.1 succinyl-CoA ligase [ADP-forming] subunit beta [Ehrlichia chaffeensis str. Heartland]AHX05270.1 succinyl-CoA ligase [ADP-forming] subunit beta [Ehrlichi
MNIHEYQAKHILSKFGVNVPKGVVVHSLGEVDGALSQLNSKVVVVKAQIHAGGRGKAGGVVVSRTLDETKTSIKNMLGSTLITHQTSKDGQKVRKVYLEEGCNIKKEYYISAIVNRKQGQVSIIFSTEGGVDIEEVAATSPEKVIVCNINPVFGFQGFHGRNLCFDSNLSLDQTRKISDIAGKIYKAVLSTDANQIEINPLVETSSGEFIALDAKINFDDNALYRHPDIQELRDYDEEIKEEIEASKHGLSYIKMDGNIGCMVNGAGLAMATMDIIKYYGAEPANFLDVGGGASQKTVTEAFKIILADDKVNGILVNIFGGIMRCDIIANGIIAAIQEIGINVPLVVRLSGTNFELGKKLLDDSNLNIITANDLSEAAYNIVNIVRK